MDKVMKIIVENLLSNNNINREMLVSLLDKYMFGEELLHAVCLLTNLETIPEVPEYSKVGVSYKGGIRMEEATLVEFNPFSQRVKFSVTRSENKWFTKPEDAKKFCETGSYYNMDCNDEYNENHPYNGTYSRKHFNEISLEEWLKNAK